MEVRYADSEDIQTGNHSADKMFDLQESTYWQTQKGVNFEHFVVIDLGKVHTLTAIECLPRMESNPVGAIHTYNVYVSEKDFEY